MHRTRPEMTLECDEIAGPARTGVACLLVTAEQGPKQEKALAMGEHLMISAAIGAGYGALRSRLNLSAIPAGPLYGLGVYALNLGGVGPAIGATAGPRNEQPMTVGRRVMMHVMYGAVTALVAEQVRRQLA